MAAYHAFEQGTPAAHGDDERELCRENKSLMQKVSSAEDMINLAG